MGFFLGGLRYREQVRLIAFNFDIRWLTTIDLQQHRNSDERLSAQSECLQLGFARKIQPLISQ